MTSMGRYLAIFFQYSVLASRAKAECPDALAAVVRTLDCIEQQNVTCATEGYNSDRFIKLHNDLDTNTVIDSGGEFWTGAFALLNLSFEYKHMSNLEVPNQAHIRYIENVVFTDGTTLGLPQSTDYPFGAIFFQHEDALVTVDDECKIVMWDQYGDNMEQAAVDEASLVLLCAIGVYPAAMCVPPTAPPSPDTSHSNLPTSTTKRPKMSGKKKAKKVKA